MNSSHLFHDLAIFLKRRVGIDMIRIDVLYLDFHRHPSYRFSNHLHGLLLPTDPRSVLACGMDHTKLPKVNQDKALAGFLFKSCICDYVCHISSFFSRHLLILHFYFYFTLNDAIFRNICYGDSLGIFSLFAPKDETRSCKADHP